jgi:hypothetical protein
MGSRLHGDFHTVTQLYALAKLHTVTVNTNAHLYAVTDDANYAVISSFDDNPLVSVPFDPQQRSVDNPLVSVPFDP